jgi:hypothetical protein
VGELFVAVVGVVEVGVVDARVVVGVVLVGVVVVVVGVVEACVVVGVAVVLEVRVCSGAVWVTPVEEVCVSCFWHCLPAACWTAAAPSERSLRSFAFTELGRAATASRRLLAALAAAAQSPLRVALASVSRRLESVLAWPLDSRPEPVLMPAQAARRAAVASPRAPAPSAPNSFPSIASRL